MIKLRTKDMYTVKNIIKEKNMENKKGFLPVNKNDLKLLKIDQLDFIIITGDAYVDHPSFGTAIIGRII